MEKDIKIINEIFMKQAEQNAKHHFWFEIDYDDTQKLKQAIEHLIARNKELEENYINPSKARFSYYDTGKGTKVVIEGFIPKSKIKEKIEELERISDNGMNAVRFASTHEDEIERIERQKNISTMISILQELLDD